jgi:transcription antitermination factor NusG
LSAIPSSSSAKWFALQVRPRREKSVADVLGNKGFEHFVPLYEISTRWRGRPVVRRCPLFAGYVFCRFDPCDRQIPIVTTPGLLRVVGYGKKPIAIADEEISALQSVSGAGLAAEPCPYIERGTRVRIQSGVLEGVEGLLVNFKNQDRLLLSIRLLQRSIVLEIERFCVSPIGHRVRSDGRHSVSENLPEMNSQTAGVFEHDAPNLRDGQRCVPASGDQNSFGPSPALSSLRAGATTA